MTGGWPPWRDRRAEKMADAGKPAHLLAVRHVRVELALGFCWMLHHRDHPPCHEPRRPHRSAAPGHLGDLDDSPAGRDLDPTTCTPRHHVVHTDRVTRVHDDLYPVALHWSSVPDPGGCTSAQNRPTMLGGTRSPRCGPIVTVERYPVSLEPYGSGGRKATYRDPDATRSVVAGPADSVGAAGLTDPLDVSRPLPGRSEQDRGGHRLGLAGAWRTSAGHASAAGARRTAAVVLAG
jgi:hypothetical protein